MPNHLNPRERCYHAAEVVVSDAHEAEIGYEAALPYLLGGQDGARWHRDARPLDAPLSYSRAPIEQLGAAGPDS